MTTAGGPQDARSGAPTGRSPAKRDVLFAGYSERLSTDILDRATLGLGDVVIGPTIVEQADTTILIEPGSRGAIGDGDTLRITRGES